jgi:glycosyltransferase involved in cell wall biosynthesis
MKIVYLHQYFNTPNMAGGTRSYEMARRLVDWGHEVHMVTSWREETDRRGWYEEIIDGIHVHWLPVGYSNKMGFFSRIVAFFRFAILSAFKAASLPADVVFATSTPLTIALPGVYAARRKRVPLVFEVRDLWPQVPIALGVLKNPLLVGAARWLERFAYARSARVVTLAPGMAEGVVAVGGRSAAVSIVPNGCDVVSFRIDEDGPIDLVPTVLYIGTVGPANGVEYVPRLAAALRTRFPERVVRFDVIGDGKCLEAVKALARKLGLGGDRIRFFGALPKKDIPLHLARCRATIMTYDGPEVLYRDSVSNKFFDSLAAGKPVVANFAGFSTLVAKAAGVGGILPRDDMDSAADMLVEIVDNVAFLDNAGIVAQKLANETFSRDRLARMLEQVLQQAVRDPDPAAGIPVGEEFRGLWASAREVSGC